jgi:sec-independent protein translocase protein TatA
MTPKMEIALIIIGAILLLLVGGKKLPELARGIGEAGRELRKGFNGDEKKDDNKDDTKKS